MRPGFVFQFISTVRGKRSERRSVILVLLAGAAVVLALASGGAAWARLTSAGGSRIVNSGFPSSGGTMQSTAANTVAGRIAPGASGTGTATNGTTLVGLSVPIGINRSAVRAWSEYD